MGKAGKAAASMPSYVRREASLFPLFSFSLPERALFAPSGHLPHLEEKANGRSFEPTCASNECAFAGSWRDVLYKYAALRVLTQCTTSLKAGMGSQGLGIRHQASDIRRLTSALRPSGIASYICAAKPPPPFLISDFTFLIFYFSPTFHPPSQRTKKRSSETKMAMQAGRW